MLPTIWFSVCITNFIIDFATKLCLNEIIFFFGNFKNRCGYGGCIDEKNRCDGNPDCFDESDENYLLCKL